MIRQHLLPLTKINEKGQYALVQPFLVFFLPSVVYVLFYQQMLEVLKMLIYAE